MSIFSMILGIDTAYVSIIDDPKTVQNYSENPIHKTLDIL